MTFRFGSMGWLLFVLCACSRSGLEAPQREHECLPLPPDGRSSHQITAEVSIDRTDILFLIDTSISMADEIQQIRAQLVDVLVPQIRDQVRDPNLGVASFSDFASLGGKRTYPYRLLQEMTDDVPLALEAIEGIELEFGGDAAESQLEALYQAATGEGLGQFVEPVDSCVARTRGGACFRQNSLGIVMLFTDAPMRNVAGLLPGGAIAAETGDDPSAPGTPYIPVLRTYEETLAALQAQNLRVIGLWSGGDGPGLDDMRRITHDSNALEGEDDSIVFDIGESGSDLSAGVLETLASVTSSARARIELLLADGDVNDGFDPRSVIYEVRALYAEPENGAIRDGALFLDAIPGTSVTFELVFDTSAVPPSAFDRRYPLEVTIEASDGTQLLVQTFDIEIAASDLCE